MYPYHIYALLTGFVLDLIIGDPEGWPHPICLIGNVIHRLDELMHNKKNLTGAQQRRRGLLLVVIVVVLSVLIPGAILFGAYWIHMYLGFVVESIMTYQILATKNLHDESRNVAEKLRNEGLEAGRKAVARIVGRDTAELSEAGVIKATIETVAENTSDGVVAPMIFLAIGGPIGGFLYKAINTMDSMIGYKNDQYLDFGRYGAKLDDIANYIPARICAGIMMACSSLNKLDGRNAYRIWKRDRYQHASPNSAQTESVMAGALQVQLAGDAYYFGVKHVKPYIGDPIKKVTLEDIDRANGLLYSSAIGALIVCIAVEVLWMILL